MDFTYVLNTAIPKEKALLEYGFKKSGEEYLISTNLDSKFYSIISISNSKIQAQVYETETEEKYFLLDVVSATGTFVSEMRQKVTDKINEIKEQCFYEKDIKNEYCSWINTEIGVQADFPWGDDAEYEVYRLKNNKWFALVMKIKFKNLGFESDEPVWAVNLKADPEKIPELIDRKSIFPAWHMNKKYWITVLLTAVTDLEKLKELTVQSSRLVAK